MQQLSHEPAYPPVPLAVRWSNRLVGLALVVGPGSLLAVASRLTPDARGMRTHEQLGLPPCGFAAVSGYPCPTCGMTTAFAHAAHGQIVDAVVAQPFGGLLAIASACAVLIGAYALVTDLPLAPLFRPANRMAFLYLLLALFLGSWTFKILAVRHGTW
ncbi:MAG: DUF2752 domain-containing protein [Planctomycetota bacterium]|nr:DUF2752 domain-containing protein [Planctomycetota bacterium]